MKKKTSWDYQKGKYKQVSIRFLIEDQEDMLLYHYLNRSDNITQFIKYLIRMEMFHDAQYKE